MKFLKLAVLAPILLASSAIWSQSTDADSAKNFAQHFYDWYVPRAQGISDGRAARLALDDRPGDFSIQLATALKDQFAAQSGSAQHALGLYYDPFLNTKTPCERYVVGNVTTKGNLFLAEIFPICSGVEQQPSIVSAELKRDKGRWQIVDFFYPNVDRVYPNRGTLLSLLHQLQAARDKSAH